MCARQQPLNGADSGPVPYIVTLNEGDYYFKVRVPKAYGPKDAGRQALLDHSGYDVIRAKPEKAS